jgi:hypothetical protein
MVPISGTYSLTPPQGVVVGQVTPAEAHVAPQGSAVGDGQVMRAIPPATLPRPMTAQPALQYVIPTTPPASATIQYTAPQAPATPPVAQYLPPPMPVNPKPMEESATPAANTVPPPPCWPTQATEGTASSDVAVPPPPPPIHRTSESTPQLP